MNRPDIYRELFERSADALLIIRDGLFVDCNDATLKMLRYDSKQDLLNTHPSQLSPAAQSDGRPSFEKADEMMALAFAKGSHRFEWDHRRADGEIFPVEVLLTAFEEHGRKVLHVVWREISDRRQREDELQRLTSIIESTSDLVSMATPDGRIIYLNRAGKIMLGWEGDSEISKQTIAEIHPSWVYTTIRDQAIPHAIKHGLWVGETAICNCDGLEIPVSQVIIAHGFHHGSPTYLSTIMRDIRGAKYAEWFLNSIIDTIPDPIFVKNEQHQFVTFNRACCDFLGYEREKLMGKTDYDLFPHGQASVFRAKDELVLQSGKENINEELITDSSGTVHTISTKKSSFADEAGNRFLVGVIRDITDLKQTEQQLQNNVQLLNSIIETQPTCVKLINIRGELLEMNPAGLSILKASAKSEVVGKTVYQLISEEDRERFRQFNEAVCRGDKGGITFAVYDLEGGIHMMDSVAVPLRYGPGGEIVQLAISRDITRDLAMQEEQERLRNSLRQSQKMEAIGTLAGGIAHDFNNILTAILGYSELALHEISQKDSKVARDIRQILKAGQRAKNLVSRILTFSRKTDTDIRPVRINTIITETLQLLRASLPTTISINQDIILDCPTVLADPTQIEQVVMNLCTNASHAMRKQGGKLGISLRLVDHERHLSEAPHLDPEKHYLVLEVSDTGCGMDQTVLQRIFEPYFTTKDKGEGTGLGLSVVHGIVQLCGGHISVVSETGKGTSFLVFIPCTDPVPEEELPEEYELQYGTEKIIVVDDEPMVVDIMARQLRRLGYEVTPLVNSTEALQCFRRNTEWYDMLISDITMPGMTGMELADQVHKLRPDLPVILCTGYKSGLRQERTLEPGGAEVITKPIDPKKFAKVVRKVLDRSKKRAELANREQQ